MQPNKSIRHSLFCLLVVLAQLLTACSGLVGPKATPTRPPLRTSTPSPTSVSDRTNQPDVTPTWGATPTPAGFYSNTENGYSFTVPLSFVQKQDADGKAVFYDQSMQLAFTVSSQSMEQKAAFDTVIKEYFAKNQFKAGQKKQIMIGDGIVAQSITGTVKAGEGDQDFRLYYVYSGKRAYLFYLTSQPGGLDSSQAAVDQILKSIRVFTPWPYGLDPNQTLSIAGKDPTLKDMDPAQTLAISSLSYVKYLFAGLVKLDANLKPAPDLAESWKISPDGLVYTFTLRDHLKYASGDPIIALDFKDAWERAADPKTQSQTALLYLGDIAGVREKLSKQASEISGVTAPDNRTLQVSLEKPVSAFLYKLTTPPTFVYKAFETMAKDWPLQADFSGPYRILKYNPGKSILFTSNTNYLQAPAIPNIVYTFNPANSLGMFQAGSLDMLVPEGNDSLQVEKSSDPLHNRLHSVTGFCTEYLAVDASKPPFDDLQVRQAFAMATEREDQTNTLLPPGVPGYRSFLGAPIFDQAAAKKALNQSNYKGRLPGIVLTVPGSSSAPNAYYNLLADKWNRYLGAQVRVQYLNPETFLTTAPGNHGGLIYSFWCADYPDPENFLDPLLAPGSPYNFGGYSNDSLMALLDLANMETDPQKADNYFRQAEKLVLDDVAIIPIGHPKFNILISPRVSGYSPTSLYFSGLMGLSLKPEQ